MSCYDEQHVLKTEMKKARYLSQLLCHCSLILCSCQNLTMTIEAFDIVKYIKNSKYSELWNRVFNAYVKFPEIIGGTNRADTNLIKNSN